MAATADARNVIGEATLGELQAALRGPLIRPGDPDYDEARAVWNAAHDKHPALIVRCTGTADVIRAVEFARSEGLPLAVRGGAHSIAGFSTCDDGVVIDLSPMQGVHVDPAGRRAVAQGGLTWSDFDHETQAFGLAVTGGLVSTTGIAGFTLGGGIGWLLRKYGLTCDNLLSARRGHCRRPARHRQRATSTPSCSGRCAAAAATSASSPRWSIACTRSARRSSPARCSTAAATRPRCSGAGGTSPPRCPTSSPPWPTSSSPRRCRSCQRPSTARWWSASLACTPVRSRTAPRPPSRCGPWPNRSPT